MATIKIAYGSKTTIATTALTSLASGSGWQSAVIDNTSNLFLDAMVRVQTKGQAGSTNLMDFYVYNALSDTTYTDGASGSDAAFTAGNRFNARYVGSILLNAATSAVQGSFSIAQAFGGVMPSKWGLIAINNSGGTLSTTAGDHLIEYEGITQTVA